MWRATLIYEIPLTYRYILSAEAPADGGEKYVLLLWDWRLAFGVFLYDLQYGNYHQRLPYA
jgi:hypothetical protein